MRWLGKWWFPILMGVVMLLWRGWKHDPLIEAIAVAVVIGALAGIAEGFVRRYKTRTL